jgi:hypothetical protein
MVYFNLSAPLPMMLLWGIMTMGKALRAKKKAWPFELILLTARGIKK